MSSRTLAPLIILAVIAVFVVWFAIVMAICETAVTRISRSTLNNMVVQVQTNDESDFVSNRKLTRIHRVQGFVAHRHATAASCSFMRIVANIFEGVLVATMAQLAGAPVSAQIPIGLVVALVVAIISNLVRPRTSSVDAVHVMMQHSRLVAACLTLTPFTLHSRKNDSPRSADQDLSDDEEVEKAHLEQGKAAIERLVENRIFDKEISEMLRNVLTLSDTLTREIMVPRTDMFCIGKDTSLGDLLKTCSRSGFSRVPIVGESIDDLIGVAYLKDAVKAVAFNPDANGRSVESIAREPLLVPESKPVDDLFHDMQTHRQHVAMVVDEYGGIAGLVTIEDALEQIVGEMEDEHDKVQRQDPVKMADGSWKVPARTSLADIEELFEMDIDEDDVDTVYGLLTKALGSVPIVGSTASIHGLQLTAVDQAGRRKKVSTIVVQRDDMQYSTRGADNEDDAKDKESGEDHD